MKWRVCTYFEITIPGNSFFSLLSFSCFRPMWRARTRRLRQPPFRPLADVPPTSLRWRTLVSTVWCCCFPTETVINAITDYRNLQCFYLWLSGFVSFVRTYCIVFAETVVAESVVVIKKLLQTQPTQHSEIIKHMAKLFDNITVWVIILYYYFIYCWSICICSTWKFWQEQINIK